MLAYRSSHAKQFFTDVLSMKYAAAKIVPKITKFLAKTTFHGFRSGDAGGVQ